ncbi:MAG: hypothetical protein LBN05_00815 [Oscillospiraceae bacterium]|jgi:hypothetical protein|nr:hypothetical protein [Oscillospiraceae bacterium]
MNIFKLKEYDQNHLLYLYQPEGRGKWGEILYDFVNGVAQIVTRADESSSWHDRHALSKVEECAKAKSLPLSFTQAWY